MTKPGVPAGQRVYYAEVPSIYFYACKNGTSQTYCTLLASCRLRDVPFIAGEPEAMT